ncbi:CaiB/BaiF CoA transferase family protein [Burkholderia diffusa]|uniref:CaiB/BaiF CoA transferase family protein n=1 Tax=Burkholderia diffusa TaxID=488732 RepID=UPI00157B17E1|nr:CoA transferase [Burkholderia diffusa]NTY41592.1 CoA transferase [Burkholderia diffusa]
MAASNELGSHGGSGQGPLSGIKIVDFTRVLAGPFATALLADLGAEVIKIESPQGDDYRHVGPFVDGQSVLFMFANRAKKSVVLDLKNDEDLAKATALTERADVVIENFRPGVAKKLGIGHEALRARNKRLVYASISGFGQNSTSNRPAYDLVVQALTGLMSINGESDRPPMIVGEAFGDLSAGLFASWGILAALVQRNATGEGCYLDVAMFDTLLTLMPTATCTYVATGNAPKRVGNRHPLSAPFGAFAARNGNFILAVLNNKLFGTLAELIERPDLIEDPRYRSDESRSRNEDDLRNAIEEWSRRHDVSVVLDMLSCAGIPCAPIADVPSAVDSEQAENRALFRRGAMGGVNLKLPEQPVHFSSMARGRAANVPELGEHTPEMDQWLSDK